MSDYEAKKARQSEPHAFEPMPLTDVEGPDHVCRGRCACAVCMLEKRDPIHKDRRP